MSTRGADGGGSGGGRQADGHRWGWPRRAMAGDRHRPRPGPTPALPGGVVAQPALRAGKRRRWGWTGTPRRREREREGGRGRERKGRQGPTRWRRRFAGGEASGSEGRARAGEEKSRKGEAEAVYIFDLR